MVWVWGGGLIAGAYLGNLARLVEAEALISNGFLDENSTELMFSLPLCAAAPLDLQSEEAVALRCCFAAVSRVLLGLFSAALRLLKMPT